MHLNPWILKFCALHLKNPERHANELGYHKLKAIQSFLMEILYGSTQKKGARLGKNHLYLPKPIVFII